MTNRRWNFVLVLVVVLSLLPMGACGQGPAGGSTKHEAVIGPGGDDLLALILKTEFKSQGYTIVEPRTRLGMGDSQDPKEAAQSQKYIREGLKIEGYDPTALVEALYAANAKPARLTLPSNKDEGYLVDYEARFDRYFEGEGGGWEKLRKENPLAAGMTSVSLPVIDREAGIVLVYLGTQYDYLAGSGGIVAFRLEKGELHQIAAVRMWIS